MMLVRFKPWSFCVGTSLSSDAGNGLDLKVVLIVLVLLDQHHLHHHHHLNHRHSLPHQVVTPYCQGRLQTRPLAESRLSRRLVAERLWVGHGSV